MIVSVLLHRQTAFPFGDSGVWVWGGARIDRWRDISYMALEEWTDGGWAFDDCAYDCRWTLDGNYWSGMAF